MESDEIIVKALEKVFTKLGETVPVIFKLKGFILDDRFKLSKSMAEGAFGKVFTASEVGGSNDDKKHNIVVKFTQSHAMNDREFAGHLAILESLKTNEGAAAASKFAQVFTKGKVLLLDPKLCTLGNRDLGKLPETELVALFEQQLWSYMTLRRYGDTLEKYLFKRNEPFSLDCSIKIGMKLLEQLRIIHAAGYTYNDLKLDNVLVGECRDEPNYKYTRHRIRIIDFGLVKHWLDPITNEHTKKKRERYFQGNMIFASKNAFNLFTQSRRDDLMSLCYVLLYIIDGDLAFLQQDGEGEGDGEEKSDTTANFKEDEFTRLRKAKNAMPPEELTTSKETKMLIPFMDECFSYRFADAPDYAKLERLLEKILLDSGVEPDNKFDWNHGYAIADESELPQAAV